MMHVQKKVLADGTEKFYLRYWKNGKNRFVPKRLYPDFNTKDEAKEWAKEHAAKIGAQLNIQKYTEAMNRAESRKKYHNFDEYIALYENWQKDPQRAPNSWKNNMLYLDRYVLKYFLDIKGNNNLNLWYTDFQGFIDWLANDATVSTGWYTKKKKKQGSSKKISYSTANHCIRTLNNFIRCMKKYNKIEPTFALRCECFKQKLVNKNARTYKDIIDKKEYEELLPKLSMSKEFFMVLYHTGMRFNELYSLSIADIFEGQEGLSDFVIETVEEKLEGEVYGYISLKSQVATKNCRTRNRLGHVPRKPLKGRDTEEEKDGRLIPIHDAEVWDILVDNYNRAYEEFEKKRFKSKKKQDYFIFDISPSEIRKEFRKFCKKGFHACRHSRITYLVGKTQSMIFCRLLCGHRSESFNRYNHTWEMWLRDAAKKPQKQRLKKIGKPLKVVS